MQAVGCEKSFSNNRICGITAIERCATCSGAYCRQHAGYGSGRERVDSTCADCWSAKVVAMPKTISRQEEARLAQPSREALASRAKTLASSRRGDTMLHSLVWKPGRLSPANGKYVPKEYQRGWLVGDLPFTWSEAEQNEHKGGHTDAPILFRREGLLPACVTESGELHAYVIRQGLPVVRDQKECSPRGEAYATALSRLP